MTIVGGWLSWAIPLPIPDIDKLIRDGGKLISTNPTPVEWQTFHSQEGYVQIPDRIRAMAGVWPELSAGDRFEVIQALGESHWEWANPARPTTAWHGTNLQNCGPRGALVQHAPAHARLAHGHASNPHGPGWEAEGILSQPLDEGQRAVVRRILDESTEHYGLAYSRANRTIREHRESGPTLCPSERYTALWAELEVDMATLDEINDKLDILARAGFSGFEERGLTEDERTENAWRRAGNIAAANVAELAGTIDEGDLASVAESARSAHRMAENAQDLLIDHSADEHGVEDDELSHDHLLPEGRTGPGRRR